MPTPSHLLQIWIMPAANGIEPSYEQTYFDPDTKRNQLRLVGSRDGREGSVTIHQDVNLYAAQLAADATVTYDLPSGRIAWVQVARGSLTLNGHPLTAGDGAAISQETTLTLTGNSDDSEVLLFDMTA
jgi:redox-sensitive bicupin YhaK (pirin superfamily)